MSERTGSSRRRPRVSVVLVGAVLAVGAWLAWGPEPEPAGVALPPAGSVTADFVDGHPVFVVHDAEGTIRVLDAVDPHSPAGFVKVLAWCRSSGRFEDLWHGSRFDRTGAYLGGPAPTGLAAYPVVRREHDRVVVGSREAAPARWAGGRGGTEPAGPACDERTALYAPGHPVDLTVLDDLVVHPADEQSGELWFPTPERIRGEEPAHPQ